MTMRTYTRRDSATAVLRKMGIKARDYDLFIKKREGSDKLDVNVGLAKQHLKNLEQKASKKSGVKRVTISSLARQLILEGKTNEEVFKGLQDEFGSERIDEEKRYYPSWYRCELRRKGLLTEETDK